MGVVGVPTVVFYQIDYSLYTTWQARQRVWCPGQVLPVRVVFVAYRKLSSLSVDRYSARRKSSSVDIRAPRNCP